jgi:hypothetical protein
MRYWFLLGVIGLTVSSAQAGVVPVIPRLPAEALRPQEPDKKVEEAPQPKTEDEAKADAESDPNKLADRISKNTKTASDKLKEEDPGAETRKTQEQILKDIDELLKQAQNPPPMSGGGGGSSDMPPPDGSPPPPGGQPKGGNQPMGGSKPKGGNQPKGGSQPMGGNQPKGGEQNRPSWRERDQQEKSGDQPDKAPMPKGGKEGKDGQEGKKQEKQPKGPGKEDKSEGGKPDDKNPMGGASPGQGGKSTPTLPLDDAITKQVWGHLPEKLRQQMSQYYKEQFMPKYGDMLRQYYNNLAEREKAPKKGSN